MFLKAPPAAVWRIEGMQGGSSEAFAEVTVTCG